MANQRKPGQTFVGFQLEDDLLALIDAAREFKDRSIFIREAVAEKLLKMGYEIQRDWVYRGRVKNVAKGNVSFGAGASVTGSVVMGNQYTESQKKNHSNQNDPDPVQFQPAKNKNKKSKKSD